MQALFFFLNAELKKIDNFVLGPSIYILLKLKTSLRRKQHSTLPFKYFTNTLLIFISTRLNQECSLLNILLILMFITMTILQQIILKTPIYLMTIISSKLLLNSLSQFARLCGLAVMTRDL